MEAIQLYRITVGSRIWKLKNWHQRRSIIKSMFLLISFMELTEWHETWFEYMYNCTCTIYISITSSSHGISMKQNKISIETKIMIMIIIIGSRAICCRFFLFTFGSVYSDQQKIKRKKKHIQTHAYTHIHMTMQWWLAQHVKCECNFFSVIIAWQMWFDFETMWFSEFFFSFLIIFYVVVYLQIALHEK